MSNTEIGKFLKQLRGNRSYREIERLANHRLSHNYVAQTERGESRGKTFLPSPEKLKVFSDVYGVSYNRLMMLAGYSEDVPEWATNDDVVELERMLGDDVTMSFGGEDLTEAEEQRVKDVLTTLFWDKLKDKRL